MYNKALKWPIITWIVVDVVLLILALIFSGLAELFTPAVLSPLLLAFGLWGGYRIAENGGGYGGAIVVGVVLGLVCAVLIVIGFSIIGMAFANVFPVAVYGLAMNFFGALVGGGFVLSK